MISSRPLVDISIHVPPAAQSGEQRRRADRLSTSSLTAGEGRQVMALPARAAASAGRVELRSRRAPRDARRRPGSRSCTVTDEAIAQQRGGEVAAEMAEADEGEACRLTETAGPASFARCSALPS